MSSKGGAKGDSATAAVGRTATSTVTQTTSKSRDSSERRRGILMMETLRPGDCVSPAEPAPPCARLKEIRRTCTVCSAVTRRGGGKGSAKREETTTTGTRSNGCAVSVRCCCERKALATAFGGSPVAASWIKRASRLCPGKGETNNSGDCWVLSSGRLLWVMSCRGARGNWWLQGLCFGRGARCCDPQALATRAVFHHLNVCMVLYHVYSIFQ